MSTIIETPPQITPDNCCNTVEPVFEPHPYQQARAGRFYEPNYRTICSIWPDALSTTMLHAGQRKTYAVPGAPSGTYALLRVYDTWTSIRNIGAFMDDGNPPQPGDEQSPHPISCDGIVTDLIRIWAKDAPGNAGGSEPGVAAVEGDVPTQLELDGLFNRQTEYFKYLVLNGDSLWLAGKREYVTEDHRRALRWLGSEDRDWYRKILPVLLKKCPACAEQINRDAIQCRFCQTSLVEFYRKTGLDMSDADPAVYAFMAQIEAARRKQVATQEKNKAT